MEVGTRYRHKSTLLLNAVPVIHETVIKFHRAARFSNTRHAIVVERVATVPKIENVPRMAKSATSARKSDILAVFVKVRDAQSKIPSKNNSTKTVAYTGIMNVLNISLVSILHIP